MSFAPISTRRAREAAAEVNAKGSQALALKVDVTSRSDVNAMVERSLAAFSRVHFLFNSAGAAIRRAKFLEIDDALMEKTFALNVNGTFYAMQALLPHFVAHKPASSSTWRAWRTAAALPALPSTTPPPRARSSP
jgi:NAD(P)-dependent dehydrogenase (short-subunit alcohol dehydrogenase family)